MNEAKTHNVIRTQVVQIKGDVYAAIFSYDDGTENFAEAGSKENAEFYANVQKGETFPVGLALNHVRPI